MSVVSGAADLSALALPLQSVWDLYDQNDPGEFWYAVTKIANKAGTGKPRWAKDSVYLQSRMEAPSCGHSHCAAIAGHQFLELPIVRCDGGAIRVSEMLEGFLATSSTEGLCNTCYGHLKPVQRVGLERSTLIKREVLVLCGAVPSDIFVTLSRVDNGRRRLQHHVLADRLTVEFLAPPSSNNGAFENNFVRRTYEPTAFIDHHFYSASASTGHYTATVLEADGKWRLFDDERVSVVPAPDALTQRGSRTTYTVRYSLVAA